MRKNAKTQEKEPPIRPIRQRAIDKMATETMAMLAREGVFPKRTRWQYAESLARLVNIADSLSNIADSINPSNRTEYAVRHMLNIGTVWVLTALDAKMTQAMRVLNVDANKLDSWTKLFKAARGSMYRQINRDKAKYIPLYGEPVLDGLQLPLELLAKLLGICSF